MHIHPSAVIHPEASIGAETRIGPCAVIEEAVTIGERCVIGAHAVIHPYTRLGPETRVHAGAVIGDWPQDLAFSGVASRVEIGTGCVLREGVTVHRGTKEGTVTRVGDRCFLMANSHVAHNCVLGNDVILANGVLLGGYVEIGDRVFLSGNCVVHQFIHIGRLAMMSGLSAVSKDLPPFCVVHNLSVNHVSGLNVVGMRRAGLSPEERKQVKSAFNILYRSGLNVKQAVERMKAEFPDGPAAELWQFAESSQRGICAPSRTKDGED